jgi:hypothetical protein
MSLESISWYSEKTGFTRETCAKRLANVPFQDGPKAAKLYETREALPALFEVPQGGQQMDLARERALLAKSQRTKLDMEIEVLRGKLLPADKVESAWASLAAAFRARMLSLPSKCAPMAVGAAKVIDAERLIEDAVHDALNELSGGDLAQRIVSDLANAAECEPPAAEVDREPVGEPKPTPKRRGQRRAGPVQH